MTEFDPRKMLGGDAYPKFDKIKLGSGVVGKITNSVLALFGLVTVIAWNLRTEPICLLCLLGVAVVVFVFYAVAVLWFAAKNPASAALEGADLVAYRRLEMASKTEGEIIEGTVNRSTQSLPSQSTDGDAA